MKNVSFIIPCYNSEKTIEGTINSIISQNYKNKFEVIVIDDKSTDNSLEKINKYKMKIIENNRNIGLASSLNKAIRLSRYKLIAIIWPDTILNSKDWLKDIILIINSNKKIAAVSSRLIITKKIWKKINFWKKISLIDQYKNSIKNKKVMGRPSLFKKEILKSLNYYDNKTFRIAGEDTDLRLKTLKLGYKIPTSKKSELLHLHGFNKSSLIKELLNKSLPLAEAAGVIYRKHNFIEGKYLNFIVYTILYLLLIIPIINYFALTLIILISIIYTLKALFYIKNIKIILLPLYKIIKDILSIIGFWKGVITKKQIF